MPHGIGRPIGVFDSGVGGLTVLRACIAALPGEDVVYFGDTAWFPYGERDPAEVRARALAIGAWLADQGVKLVAVACNTATAVALPGLQRALPQPVIGPIRPDVHAAVRATRNRRVGVLATAATIASGAYPRMARAYDAGVRVTGVACPGLAAAVQNGGPLDAAVADLVARCAAPLREAGVDTAILGCTHFPAVAPLVRDALPGVTIIEGGAEMAGEVADALARRGVLRPAGGAPGTRRFACSGDPDAFRALGERVLGAPIGDVEVVDPGLHQP
ncbi:MAG: glutamate racemase [Thermoleophilia bacterium]